MAPTLLVRVGALAATIAVGVPASGARIVVLARVVARADSTVVVLLGTGFPRPDPRASGPA